METCGGGVRVAARCPICTMELNDVDAVRRHALIDHGLTAESTGGGGWMTVPGPAGEPGWQPDPWNSAAMRWWDGQQWSGRTAPLGSAPADGTGTAGGAGGARSDGGRRQGPSGQDTEQGVPGGERPSRTAAILIGAAALVAVVVLAAVVLTGHHPSPSTKAAALPSATSAPAQAPGSKPALAGLADAVLTPVDLGGGWTASPAPGPLAAPDYTTGPCHSPLWAHDVGGYQSRLVNGGGGDVRSGYVESDVLEAPSPTAATAEAAFMTSSSYVPCLKATLTGQLEGDLSGTGIQLAQVSADPLTLDVPGTSQGYAVTVGLIDPGAGLGEVITDDHVDLFNGRYEASLDIVSCSCRPFSQPDIVQQQAARLAQRLAGLPPDGTAKSI